jgi:hypothetical protein
VVTKSDKRIDKYFEERYKNMLERNQVSLLDVIFEFSLMLHQEFSKEISIQTSESGPNPKEILEEELLNIRKQYESSSKQLSHNRHEQVEGKLLAYQGELEKRKQAEIDVAIRYYKENDRSRIQLEVSEEARISFEKLRKEMEFEYQQRFHTYLEREQQAAKAFAEKEHDLQRQLYESRQAMEREIDSVRQREKSLLRKNELEAEGMRLLELRLKDEKHILENKEYQLKELEKELQRRKLSSMEEIRLELRNELQVEYEYLNQERMKLLDERKKIEEERFKFQNLSNLYDATKNELAQTKEILQKKNDQLTYIQHETQNIQIQFQQEKHDFSKELDTLKDAQRLKEMLDEATVVRILSFECTEITLRSSWIVLGVV